MELATDTKLVDSKEVGLAVGLLIGENLLGMKDLHYGLWEPDQPLTVQNLPIAQDNYSKFILSQIPSGAKRILDVGSGAGKLASFLIENGFQVDCVSPSSFLTTRLNQIIMSQGTVYPVKFEELKTEKKYDLVLFSESFQYVDPSVSLAKAHQLLSPSGQVIISDFFKKTTPSDGPLGGGHRYEEFLKLLQTQPFETLKNLDITEATAPTMELFNRLLASTALPIKNLVVDFIAHRHPHLAKFLAWKFKARFEKLNKKYFSNELGGETFKAFKTYRFFILKPKP